MNCEKCLRNEARYSVYTDEMNLEACTSCATRARRMMIAVEVTPRLRTDHQQILLEFDQDS